jgi:WD40 repeat protein
VIASHGTAVAGAPAFAHDLFVVHAEADEQFVRGFLFPELDLPPGRALWLGELALGQAIAEDILRRVHTSRITVVVLSPAYLADRWAVFGKDLAAYARTAQDEGRLLLPLLRADCAVPDDIAMLTGLDFRESQKASWEAEAGRLRELLGAPVPAVIEVPCPYPGMRPFTALDEARFFGRDAELDDLMGRLARGEREIYVIGASGSGKSSLIAAGLVPRWTQRCVAAGGGLVRTVRPGEHPWTRLAELLGADPAAPQALGKAVADLLARPEPASQLMVVVDQFEEVFSVAVADERARLFDALRALRAEPRCVLIFTLRADFYGAFMESSLWRDLDGRISRVELGALRDDNLREVIERPARDLGVYLERDLVERLLGDTADEPGALPLLQEALHQLWGKRRQRLLTLPDYLALGDGTRSGLARAVSDFADTTLRQMTAAQNTIALRILLRLVTFGEGRADTRRQQPRSALRSADDDPAQFDAVLQLLVGAHLLTVSGDDADKDVRVDLAHEILIHAWPTLAAWIKDRRADEKQRRRLEDAAAAWRASGSGARGLLEPADCVDAAAWHARANQQLGESAEVVALIAASKAAHARDGRNRRRRIQIAFGALLGFVAVVSVLALVALRTAREAEDQRQTAEHERQRAELERKRGDLQASDTRKFLRLSYQETARQLLRQSDPQPLEALPFLLEARKLGAPDEPSSALRMLFAEAGKDARRFTLAHNDDVVTAEFSPDGTRVLTACADHTARIWDAATGKPALPPLIHRAAVTSAAYSADGTRIVTASDDKTARVWDAATGKPLTPPLAHRAGVTRAAFNRDGTRIVTISDDQTVWVWDVATGKPRWQALEDDTSVRGAAFSPDGTRIVIARFRSVRVWDADTGKPTSPPLQPVDAVISAEFSPDGTRILTADQSDHGAARVWDAVTGAQLTPPIDPTGVTSAAFSPDGTRIVTTSDAARVWDARSGAPVSPPVKDGSSISSAAFSRDGARIVTTHHRVTQVWDAASGAPLSPPLQHRADVKRAVFSPDGSHIVTVAADRTATIWATASGAVASLVLQHDQRVLSAAFNHAGTRVVTANRDAARVWDVATGSPVSPPLDHRYPVNSAAFSPDDTRVVTSGDDRRARIWDWATGVPVTAPLLHQCAVRGAAFSPDGTRIVTTCFGNATAISKDDTDPALPEQVVRAMETASLWNAATGEAIPRGMSHAATVNSAVFSPDSTRIVTASADGTARIWSTVPAKDQVVHHRGPVAMAAFSPDGTRIVTASADRTAQIWDATSGEPVGAPLQHQASVLSAVFSPDGRRVVTASVDKTARVWDAASGTPVSALLQHQDAVIVAAFSPDGARVVTASVDHTARVWDAASGNPLSPPLVHQDAVIAVAFSPDGTRIVTASDDTTARIWNVPLAAGSLADWESIVTNGSPYLIVNGVLALRDPTPEAP